ncbi:MAG: GTPase Era [SAR324 cluster bacterium]|nr:GTPase Era [SAR324 cluster bacterium]
MADELTRYCGFIGVIGCPNVGKSTLLNQVVGQKISITADKPQTTRNRIYGIRTQAVHQMVFIDTPGIHTSTKVLNQRINNYALQTLKDVDLLLLLIEPSFNPSRPPQETEILQRLGKEIQNTFLVINKIDQISKEALYKVIDGWQKMAEFAEIIPVSALKGDNMDRLLQLIQKRLPENPFYFEEDQVTNVSERFLAGEFVREEIFRQMQQELPYATAVVVESWMEEPKIIKIFCVIYVERDSQKKILIGHKGEQLKAIGTNARKKIEGLLGQKVFLDMHVKIRKKWSQDVQFLDSIGLQDI